MNDDPPPPYTAVDDTKINQLTAGQFPGPGNFNLHNAQQLLLPGYPTVPPGYEVAAYYPAAAPNSAGGASVFPQPQQQQPVTTNQVRPNCPVNQVVQSDTEEAKGSCATDACILCCMCLCCCCPCFLVSFM